MAERKTTPGADTAPESQDPVLSAAERRQALLAELAAIDAAHPSIVPASDKPRKFRVLHGAVSGHGFGPSGNWTHVDYPMGKILEEKYLEPHTAELFALGAIEEVGLE